MSPLVSVLTPVYNGADYLPGCIESVLAQTYPNWNYTIVNNCSTDDSLDIARRYAAKEPRIRVLNNAGFLPKVENHNHTIRQISPESKYCKFVFADDWLFPGCIEEMVRGAEHDPSVGLVGGYTTDGQAVLWHGPPYPSRRVPGRDVCRRMLMGGQYVLGSMTSLLVRSDLVRKRASFFDEKNPYRETAACFDVLQESDYGYVHQVLSCRRPPRQPAGPGVEDGDNFILGRVCVFLKYGPAFLTNTEYQRQWKTLRGEYYRVLANNALRIRSRQYWKFHEDTLEAFHSRIDRKRLAVSVVAELARCLSRPFHSARKSWDWWSRALHRAS